MLPSLKQVASLVTDVTRENVVCTLVSGLMLGPMFLGWVADFSSVRVALQVNAVLLVLTMVYFGLVAAETKQT